LIVPDGLDVDKQAAMQIDTYFAAPERQGFPSEAADLAAGFAQWEKQGIEQAASYDEYLVLSRAVGNRGVTMERDRDERSALATYGYPWPQQPWVGDFPSESDAYVAALMARFGTRTSRSGLV